MSWRRMWPKLPFWDQVWAGRLEFNQGSDVSSILVSRHFLGVNLIIHDGLIQSSPQPQKQESLSPFHR